MYSFWRWRRSKLFFVNIPHPPARMAGKPSKRLALVIGNQTYSAFPSLSNTLNDAEAIQTKLVSLGFDVYYEKEQTRQDMLLTMSKFAERVVDPSHSTMDIVFYYAGHGCNIREHLLSCLVLSCLVLYFLRLQY